MNNRVPRRFRLHRLARAHVSIHTERRSAPYAPRVPNPMRWRKPDLESGIALMWLAIVAVAFIAHACGVAL